MVSLMTTSSAFQSGKSTNHPLVYSIQSFVHCNSLSCGRYTNQTVEIQRPKDLGRHFRNTNQKHTYACLDHNVQNTSLPILIAHSHSITKFQKPPPPVIAPCYETNRKKSAKPHQPHRIHQTKLVTSNQKKKTPEASLVDDLVQTGKKTQLHGVYAFAQKCQPIDTQQAK
jgi:hypothetical protein